MDPSKPLESMARRWYKGPLWNIAQGPTQDYYNLAVKEAIEMKADGAVWWDNFACRQAGAIKLVGDAIVEKAGIPVLRVDCDLGDPAYMSKEKIKKQVENFFELLASQKT